MLSSNFIEFFYIHLFFPYLVVLKECSFCVRAHRTSINKKKRKEKKIVSSER